MSGFGAKIRAARLGWYVAEPMGAWMRVSDADGNWRVELAPLDEPPPGRTANKEYRCIGKGRGASAVEPEILSLCSALKGVRRVKKPLVFILNEDGELAA